MTTRPGRAPRGHDRPARPSGPGPLPLDPAAPFGHLDDALPLALFPVRLEARFLPVAEPTEIVLRVFPDDVHADAHDPALTDTEVVLAQGYWDWVWRVAGEATGVSEARDWLAGQLGAHRAVYVAWASRPAEAPPVEPTPSDVDLTRPPVLRAVARRAMAQPGAARLLPLRWGAFVEVADDTRGPFWAAHPVTSPLASTPALVELPAGADAVDFLDAQGLRWVHDLDAAEAAGLVMRIPLAALPPMPANGYDRLVVVGVSSADDHSDAVCDLLEAHRYTRGLELLPPGTPTNTTEASPEGAGTLDVEALFEAEFGPRHDRESGTGPVPRPLAEPAELFTASPADAVALTFGIAGRTAADLARAADDASPTLAREANAALWPATWGAWFTDPMSRVGSGAGLLDRGRVAELRRWFVDFVRAEGPLPTLQVGRQPYGLLPVSICARTTGDTVTAQLENILLDIVSSWTNHDAVAVLDPDASDSRPSTHVAERASDVGAIYGATPHIHELRLRPVDDTHSELTELYSNRVAFTGLLCALVPKADGSYAAPDELAEHPWYEAFVEHEARIRGSDGVQGQLDALRALVDDLDAMGGTQEQQDAALAIRTYINRFEYQPPRPDGEEPAVISGDLLGIVSRHEARVADAQRYLTGLGTHDELGTDRAPRLYTGAYGEDGTEVEVGVLVAPRTDDTACADLVAWLEAVRHDVQQWQDGGPQPSYDVTVPVPLLRQLLQSAATSVARGPAAAGLERALARFVDLVATEGAVAVSTLERLLRATLGLAVYRVDAWMTALANERLGELRVDRPTGLQVGGYGWLVDVHPRPARASQGHIHAPSLDHATTAAVLRSGWSAFGTGEAGSPLAVDLSSERVRAARSIVEGVRSGQELGRLLGARFERRLHDRDLDRYVDEVRLAVLAGTGAAGRPPTRVVDGLLVARAYTDGIEQTAAEREARAALDPIVSSSPPLERAIEATVADLDAVSDVLMAQAVHALLRGDVGVAAPTLAATGSGDSGLPALDVADTHGGGQLVTVRVTATFGVHDVDPLWPGAGRSIAAHAEPRLERWLGRLMGSPTKVVVDVRSADAHRRTDLASLGLGALDAVMRIDHLGAELVAATGLEGDASIVPERPAGLDDDQLGWDEFVALARAARTLVGQIRALSTADLGVEPDGTDPRDLADLQARLAACTALVPADDPRVATLAEHRAAHPVDTVEGLLEQLRIVTVEPVPVLPLLASGVPDGVAASFSARAPLEAAAAWLTQAAQVRPALHALVTVVQMAELSAGTPVLAPAVAQTPDSGGPWAAIGMPSAPGAHAAWCNLTGRPGRGPVAGFVVDAWTETIPTTRTTSGIAVHFDAPSATAPNAILVAVTRGGRTFSLDTVFQCVRDTLVLAQFRALGPDDPHPFLGQFLPAVFLAGDAEILAVDESESP